MGEKPLELPFKDGTLIIWPDRMTFRDADGVLHNPFNHTYASARATRVGLEREGWDIPPEAA
jgi:hypothetical protein